ncbi:MAG TPA: hypothetical protein VF855_03575 [Acidimicrobiales bacterium]
MLLWFVGGSALVVWLVFHDPRLDYRLVVAGALLPDIVDGLWGGARAMHSVTAAVAALVLVMAVTVGRRSTRRRWLALPIGMFLHLVLDAAFADPKVFWWPFGGLAFTDAQLPSLDRPLAVNLVLEVAGGAMIVWFWRHFRLADPDRRRSLVRTGRLSPPA